MTPRTLTIVIFGLSVSSSWGNGHAVLWRGLITALLAAGRLRAYLGLSVLLAGLGTGAVALGL